MIKGNPLAWRIGAASLSLLAAISVYLFARIYPPELLTPLQAFDGDLAAYIGVFGSAPSLFYTLALGLFIGACVSKPLSVRVHCLTWVGLAMLLEISQSRIMAESIVIWLSKSLPNNIWAIAGPYWTHGVFDPLDLLGTSMGGAIALYFLTYLASEKRDVRD